MEKNFAEVESKLSNHRQRQRPLGAPENPPLETGKTREGHYLSVQVSYETKCRIVALAEKFELSAADIVRQVLKAGLPVLESLSLAQEQLLAGYVELLRKSRGMVELKK
jgi:predicted DNA-binding protein